MGQPEALLHDGASAVSVGPDAVSLQPAASPPCVQAAEKAAAKAEFGFTAVPFCVVFGANGEVCYTGDPASSPVTTSGCESPC